MKKLFAPALLIAGLVLGTSSSFANEIVSENNNDHDREKAAAFYKKNKEEIQNYKSVVSTFFSSNGQFQNLTDEQQNEFINSAESLKQELSQKDDYRAKRFLKKVDLTENIFRFVWESKPEYVEMDFSFEAPVIAPETEVIL
ncbi:hypothetical protein [Jiulongibacter sediminis]|uniref:DUF3887 domain-containing protein n=1 Tax=Jiulongibacter sediminis TaxID=1605367 RepID=A0A0P7C5H6_9BACT|nr:hypothetical protein [Jiulongibacter sediminis]KPM50042.1 hypothetical protein AFM12_05720 [Jiulongibacter sediminis]TBX27068.1 hypothetical protein TK44_05725 [Jiulongibacter sediminis]